jgi:hypothetical protein
MSHKGRLFTRATKSEAKARIAVTGPSGSGKTYTGLLWAEVLADSGDIAVIDTERGSAKLYADRFGFYSLSMTPPYNPERLIEALEDAQQSGFSVVVIDSLSHFWAGQGGVLEIVDEAKSRFKGNTHAAWQVGTPLQQRMLDAIIGYDGHIIATMRAKTEWAMDVDDRGRTTPRKIGLAPQQRDMIEYEFTLMLDIDVDHRASISKTRCELLADRTFAAGEAGDAANLFLGWLKSGDPLLDKNGRDRLQQAIGDLDKMGRAMLTEAWRNAGLPKVALLTTEQAIVAGELITSVAAPAVTDPEDIPTEDSEVVEAPAAKTQKRAAQSVDPQPLEQPLEQP